MRSITREPSVVLVLAILITLMGMFIIYPQIQVVLVPGLEGYFKFLGDGTWVRPLQNSLQIMLLSTSTAVLLGFVYAYAMVYSEMPWKPFFRLLGLLPLLSPPFVVAAAYLLLANIISRMLGQRINIIGFGGLWVVQTIAFFPFAYQLIADVLSRSDPRLEQAARNLGASAWNVFRTITLPLARPGLAAATLTTAIYIVEDFGNPILLLGRETVLPTQAYSLISGFGDFSGAAVVSTILLALALVLYVARLRLEGNKSYVTITGKSTSIPRPPVPRVVSMACFIICLSLALVLFVVYGVLVVSAVVQALPFNMTPTWKNFEYISVNSAPIINTFKFGAIAATACALFGLLLAFLVQRKDWFGRGAIDFIAIMPAAVPGIFWGIGYATAFNQKWFEAIAYPIFGRDGTPGALIVLALLFWNIPIGYQAMFAGLQQIDRSLDEAATSLGASALRGFRDILAPMLGSALLTGFVTAFVRAVTTLSVVIFLFTPGTTVATITIFQKVNDADWGGAAAYTILVIGMAVLVLSAVYFFSGRRAGLQKAPGG